MIVTGETEILPTPKQSPSDKKKYRLIKLQNGLKALLLKHPEADKASDSETVMKDKTSAVALCVDVGSFDDPFEVQGMSHFLEHMVRQNDTSLFSRSFIVLEVQALNLSILRLSVNLNFSSLKGFHGIAKVSKGK